MIIICAPKTVASSNLGAQIICHGGERVLLMLSPILPICHTPHSPYIYITYIIFGGDFARAREGNLPRDFL